MSSPATVNSQSLTSGFHEKHCFIVMPFGRDPLEQKWFKGWYEVVIKPAVLEAGFEPKLAAAEEQPGAINDEIRSHLASDPMVVVDLGGVTFEDEPNPNVMYELGIRHALGLPLVIMAWKGQRLPFDVSNQRIIMEDRDLVDLEQNRQRLITFIHAAKQGKFYRPMDAVGRMATIEAASDALGEDSLLKALAEEVKALRVSMVQLKQFRNPARRVVPGDTLKTMVRNKKFKKELYPHFINIGGDPALWATILRTQVPSEAVEEAQSWEGTQWKGFINETWEQMRQDPRTSFAASKKFDEGHLQAIQGALPTQPWAPGIHREVADKLGLTPSYVSRYIRELIDRGEFVDQINGELISQTFSASDD